MLISGLINYSGVLTTINKLVDKISRKFGFLLIKNQAFMNKT